MQFFDIVLVASLAVLTVNGANLDYVQKGGNGRLAFSSPDLQKSLRSEQTVVDGKKNVESGVSLSTRGGDTKLMHQSGGDPRSFGSSAQDESRVFLNTHGGNTDLTFKGNEKDGRTSNPSVPVNTQHPVLSKESSLDYPTGLILEPKKQKTSPVNDRNSVATAKKPSVQKPHSPFIYLKEDGKSGSTEQSLEKNGGSSVAEQAHTENTTLVHDPYYDTLVKPPIDAEFLPRNLWPKHWDKSDNVELNPALVPRTGKSKETYLDATPSGGNSVALQAVGGETNFSFRD